MTFMHARKSRMEILQDSRMVQCTQGCNGLWLTCAKEILDKNRIEYARFVASTVLIHDRGKYRNLKITGPAKCSKTFVLKPLTVVFDCFCNPTTGGFA